MSNDKRAQKVKGLSEPGHILGSGTEGKTGLGHGRCQFN